MKRKLVLIAVALLAVSFMGCQLMDTLFFNTEEVKASELATFTGSTPTSKNEALTSVVYGVGGTVSTMMSSMTSSEPLPAVLDKIFPAIKGSEAVFGGARAIARTISPSTGFEAFYDSIESTGAGKATVTLTNEGFNTDGIVIVNGEISLEAKGLKTGSTAASGKAAAEMDAEVKAIADTPFNGAKANVKLNANAEATLDATTGAPKMISGYAAFALSTGFSLDEVSGVSKGGKYVIAIKYTSNFDYDATKASSDPTGGLTVEIVLKVYDAANKKVGDYTYTEDEIVTFMNSMMSS